VAFIGVQKTMNKIQKTNPMNVKSLSFYLLFSFFSTHLFSQQDSTMSKLRYRFEIEDSKDLLLGVNELSSGNDTISSLKSWLAEIGFHKTSTMFGGRHGPSTYTYGVSALVSFDKEKLIGIRAGGWTSFGFLSVGISTTYYTNFKYGNLKITPEIGMGILGFKLVAGGNIPTINNKDFESMKNARFVLTINYLLKLKTIKHKLR
jgi:hypothetical protein